MCAASFIATDILWKLFKDNRVQFQTFELSLDGCYFLLFFWNFCYVFILFSVLDIIITSLQEGQGYILNSIFAERHLRFLFITDSCPSIKQPTYRGCSTLKETAVPFYPRPFLPGRSKEVARMCWIMLSQSLDLVMRHNKRAWGAH